MMLIKQITLASTLPNGIINRLKFIQSFLKTLKKFTEVDMVKNIHRTIFVGAVLF